MANPIAKPILYVEDEENDAFFMQRAFKQVGIEQPLILVSDGQQAIDYLSADGESSIRAANPLPALILLDLNLPRKSGIEVLAWLRQQDLSKLIPVIIMTSSLQDADIYRAYLSGANAYLVKPSNPEELAVMAKAIKDFWLTQNHSAPSRAQLAAMEPDYGKAS